MITCDIPEGTTLIWTYDSSGVSTIRPSSDTFPPDDPVMVGGVAFTVSLVSTTPDLVSEISFVVSSMVLRCSGVSGTGIVDRSVTLHMNQSTRSATSRGRNGRSVARRNSNS